MFGCASCVLQALLAAGANVLAVDEKGAPALHAAGLHFSHSHPQLPLAACCAIGQRIMCNIMTLSLVCVFALAQLARQM